MNHPPRVVVGITGASGAIYGIRLLEMLAEMGLQSHLVVSDAGAIAIARETSLSLKTVTAKAHVAYKAQDIAAPIASGSFRTDGMMVAPCSIRTMSEIAAGTTASLLTRAADVTLKERKKLILLVRETPLHLGHLRTMTTLTEMGAIIMPPVPAFYTAPRSIDDIIEDTVSRMLDLFGHPWPRAKRWGETA